MCVDTGKYYTSRWRQFWDAEVRNAYHFNTYEQAADEFINSLSAEDYEQKFVDDLPDNPIFKIEELFTKEYL